MSEVGKKFDREAKLNLAHVAILVVAFVISYFLIFDTRVAPLEDNAAYYILAKALAQGQGYVDISEPNPSPSNHYPPGYPAIVSLLMLFTQDIVYIKLLNGVLLIFGVILFYDIARRILQNDVLALGVSILSVLNANLLWYSTVMMSEIPFMFFSMFSLWAFMRAYSFRHRWKNPFLWLSVLSLIIAYYIRSLGIALVGAYLLFFLIRKDWKYLCLYTTAFFLGALPWFVRGLSLGGGSYVKQLQMVNPYQTSLGQAGLSDYLLRIWSNLTRYINYEIPSAVFPIKQVDYLQGYGWLDWLIGIPILILLIYGIWSLPRGRWLIAGYLLATFAILMIWPQVWVGIRFIVPVIPFLTLGVVYGIYNVISACVKSRNLPNKLSLDYNVFFGVALFISPIVVKHGEAAEAQDASWQNYVQLAEWVNQNIEEEVVISCGKPALFYLYSERSVVRYKFENNPEALLKDLEEKKVDFVVVDQIYGNTFRYLTPAVRQFPDRFESVHYLKNPDTYLLRFKREHD